MTTEELNLKLSTLDSMSEAARFLKKEFGFHVKVNQFTGKARYMIAKLIEYNYLLFVKEDLYILSINSGELNEIRNHFLNIPQKAPLIKNQNEAS